MTQAYSQLFDYSAVTFASNSLAHRSPNHNPSETDRSAIVEYNTSIHNPIAERPGAQFEGTEESLNWVSYAAHVHAAGFPFAGKRARLRTLLGP